MYETKNAGRQKQRNTTLFNGNYKYKNNTHRKEKNVLLVITQSVTVPLCFIVVYIHSHICICLCSIFFSIHSNNKNSIGNSSKTTITTFSIQHWLWVIVINSKSSLNGKQNQPNSREVAESEQRSTVMCVLFLGRVGVKDGGGGVNTFNIHS